MSISLSLGLNFTNKIYKKVVACISRSEEATKSTPLRSKTAVTWNLGLPIFLKDYNYHYDTNITEATTNFQHLPTELVRTTPTSVEFHCNCTVCDKMYQKTGAETTDFVAI